MEINNYFYYLYKRYWVNKYLIIISKQINNNYIYINFSAFIKIIFNLIYIESKY